MKKLFTFIAALLLLSACSSDAASSSPTAASVARSSQSTAGDIQSSSQSTAGDIQSSSQSTTNSPQSSSSETLPANSSSSDTSKGTAVMKLKIHVNDTTFTATLNDNSSAKALVELLQKGDLTLDMEDFSNFEKVADLPVTLPRNDTQINTDAGDIILYQGKSITIYYDKNSWDFTPLGKIDNVNKKRLKQILGDGNATVTFSVK